MRTFIIAEIGQAHEGSLGIAHSFIEALKDSGIDAIKFQTHIAQAESSNKENFRVNFSYEDKTRYDYWKRMEFSLDEWKGLKKHCDDVSIEFMSTPFSLMAVDLLEEVGVKRYKIGSGDISNFLLLEKIAKTEKPIILSSGMSSFYELDGTISFLKEFGYDKNNLSLMQCTTMYPTPAELIGLNVIEDMKKRYNLPIGLSDHSGKIYFLLAAVSMGAEILEFHVTFDKRMFGPDSTSSLTINEVKELVKGVREIERSLDNKIDKNDISKFKDLKSLFGRSLAVNKDKKAGEIIEFDDLESKKPFGEGIDIRKYREVIGKRLKVNKKKWDFLKEGDYE